MKMMRIIASAMLVLIFGISVFSHKVYGKDIAVFSVENPDWDIKNVLNTESCKQGDTVMMSVYLQGGDVSLQQNISMIKGVLEYDKCLFTVEKSDILPVDSGNVQSKSFDKDLCEFNVKYKSGLDVRDGALLLQLQLYVKDDALVGKTTVCVTHMEWENSESKKVTSVEHRIPAQLIIAKKEAVVTLGDVNLDGRIDLTDAKLAMQYYNGKITLNSLQKKNADVNKDNKVNLIDAKLIMQYYNGKISDFK